MSHVVTVDLVVKDLEALDRACQRLGWSLQRDQKTFRWYGVFMDDYHGENAAYRNGVSPETYGHCSHAVKVPGAEYEIGVVQDGNGYKLVWDNWEAGGLQQLDAFNPLLQMYGVEAAKLQAERQGLSCAWSESVTEDGSILLEATMYS